MAKFKKSGSRKLKDFQSLLASHRGEILKKSIYGEASFHRWRVSTEDGFPISNVGNNGRDSPFEADIECAKLDDERTSTQHKGGVGYYDWNRSGEECV